LSQLASNATSINCGLWDHQGNGLCTALRSQLTGCILKWLWDQGVAFVCQFVLIGRHSSRPYM